LARKNRELSRVKSNQAQFIDIVSHEYRTPLSILQANLDCIDSCLEQQRPVEKKYIEKMRFALQRLSDLLARSIEITFSGEKSLVHKCSFQPLSELLTSLQDKAEFLWIDRPINFIYEELPQNAWCNCDKQMLLTALLNLADNAVKHSVSSSPVTIHASASDKQLTLVVTNLIDPALDLPLENIFGRFNRGETSITSDGMGLGLYLARQIIEQHGGKINFTRSAIHSIEARVELPIKLRLE